MDLITPFLKIFFNLIYNQLAWTYDFVSAVVSGGRWRSWIITSERFIQGPNVLEVGFGPGHLVLHLAQSGLNIFGIDASRQMVGLAKRRLSKQYISSRLIRGQGQFPPFQNSFFNSVVATFPTAYILSPATLEAIYRILATGGCLVILLSSWVTDPSWYGRGLAWLFRVTGQTLPSQFEMQKMLLPFQNSGFEPHPEWVILPGSSLLFIIAVKK